jgi:hypothetical protein
MNLFGYEFKLSSHAKRAFNDLKIFKRRNYIHIVWFKFSVRFGAQNYCEECETRTELGESLCNECHEERFCECGTELEYKGEVMCRKCD